MTKVLLAKTKLKTIEVFISKALIDSDLKTQYSQIYFSEYCFKRLEWH